MSDGKQKDKMQGFFIFFIDILCKKWYPRSRSFIKELQRILIKTVRKYGTYNRRGMIHGLSF
ncbi:MAG: hypothetical protein E7294_12195 [Lachnospiraceae bacterium]|jgi:prephenate dehydratase|nr:hypothetical protein [Lachnospiraceae bacterium]